MWASGGDGDSRLLADVCNAAGFVRHQSAAITNFLLPIKVGGAGAEVEMQGTMACHGAEVVVQGQPLGVLGELRLRSETFLP